MSPATFAQTIPPEHHGDPPLLLTVREASAKYQQRGVTQRVLRRWIDKGMVYYQVERGRYLVDEESLVWVFRGYFREDVPWPRPIGGARRPRHLKVVP